MQETLVERDVLSIASTSSTVPAQDDHRRSDDGPLHSFLHPLSDHVALLLNMTPHDLERILYNECFVVIEPGLTALTARQVLTEKELNRVQDEFIGDTFTVETGIEAVKHLLASVDLKHVRARLNAALKRKHSKSGSKSLKDRLKLVDAFLAVGANPEWMILDVVPELRSVVPFASHQDDDLYQRVVTRNDRLKRLIELRAPEIILRNEKRMLQAAVTALLDSGPRNRVDSPNTQLPH